MIHATRREFERGFRTHIEHCKVCTNASTRLLLFYAIECGLKALIMLNHRVDHTEKLPMIEMLRHDLRECLKQLRAPATLQIRNTNTRQQVKQFVSPDQLHQAFRYGIEVENASEVIGDLNAVRDWIIKRMQ